MEIGAAREYFLRLIIERFKPKNQAIRQGANPNATAFLFHWWLEDLDRPSKEVAVLLYADEMSRFPEAQADVRGAMAEKFVRTIKTRLADGGYNGNDQGSIPFRVHIDKDDLDP